MIKLTLDAMLISIFWFVALYTLKTERIQAILVKKPKLIFHKKSIFAAKLIIFIWCIADILLVIVGNNFSFKIVSDIISMPGVSHALYLAHLFILFTMARNLTSKALETEKYLVKAEKRAVTLANGLFVLGMSVVLYFFQSTFWGELRYIYSNNEEMNILLEGSYNALLILLPGLLILYNAVNFVKTDKLRILATRVSFPIVLLLSFSQAIMTKLLVIYDFTVIIHRVFIKQFGIIRKSDSDDKLYLGSSMNYGSLIVKINAYFLTAYASTILILWTSQISPLPIFTSVYSQGTRVAFFFTLAIASFWFTEGIARSFVKVSRYIRISFIPLMSIMTVLPFYTVMANSNYFSRTTEVISIYHKMSLALGANKFLFFLCIFIIQAALAYILHMVTGEAHNDKHYYSILPVIGIAQLFFMAVMYPILLMIPPYVLENNRIFISIMLFVFAIILTVGAGLISYKLFTEESNEWSHIVHGYWKDRPRLMIIVAIITCFAFVPLGSTVVAPIHNINITKGWEQNYIKEGERLFANALLQTFDKTTAYVVVNDDKGKTRLIAISTEDGKVKWQKDYDSHYVSFKVWKNGQAVFTKVKNTGFSIIDLQTGYVHYEYKIPERMKVEHTNIEINDRTVLYTINNWQIIYDMDYGYHKLDTNSNNYYQLIAGDQCALIKNNIIYQYQYERWEKQNTKFNIADAELIYYDKNGLIVFGKEKIEQYNYFLTEKNKISYNKTYQHTMTNNKSYYNKIGDQVAFYLYSQDDVFSYLFDSKSFTFKVIPLAQRVKEYADYQKIQLTDEPGSYFLYDEQQFTLYKNQNIISRQWYNHPLTDEDMPEEPIYMVGQPLKSNNKLLWLEKNGKVHCVISKVN